MNAEASSLALAEAALRSSSDLPIFFWLRSRAAWAFWTLDPFPMVNYYIMWVMSKILEFVLLYDVSKCSSFYYFQRIGMGWRVGMWGGDEG